MMGKAVEMADFGGSQIFENLDVKKSMEDIPCFLKSNLVPSVQVLIILQ